MTLPPSLAHPGLLRRLWAEHVRAVESGHSTFYRLHCQFDKDRRAWVVTMRSQGKSESYISTLTDSETAA